MPHLENIRVFRSPVHGYGVVARRSIALGEVIAEVEGIMRTREELGDDTYCLWVDDDHYFDMVDQTRWINHSCDPNSEVEADLDGNGGAWARIVAVRDIAAGEEVTYHYGFPQELAEPCACRSPLCDGWIVEPDELPALLARLEREKREGKPASSANGAAAPTPLQPPRPVVTPRSP